MSTLVDIWKTGRGSDQVIEWVALQTWTNNLDKKIIQDKKQLEKQAESLWKIFAWTINYELDTTFY